MKRMVATTIMMRKPRYNLAYASGYIAKVVLKMTFETGLGQQLADNKSVGPIESILELNDMRRN